MDDVVAIQPLTSGSLPDNRPATVSLIAISVEIADRVRASETGAAADLGTQIVAEIDRLIGEG